ncbi:MAG: TOBE domain-containing protein [Methanobrevibacter sp.]|nr:TOBE domain-containing protein [Methanobrevibacter sp.]
MTEVIAGPVYEINIDGKIFLLDVKKYELLNIIYTTESISKAAKVIKVSYRTALNYINRIESTLEIDIVNTSTGGQGGGGNTFLTEEGLTILKECKKINAIMELDRELNEIEAKVVDVDSAKGIVTIQINEVKITIGLNEKYSVGDKILALINYDNVCIMPEPLKSSFRNIFKGTVQELTFKNDIIQVKIDIGSINVYSNITLLSSENLNLKLGKTIYIWFKTLAIATLKL